jgi:hypothetical protein
VLRWVRETWRVASDERRDEVRRQASVDSGKKGKPRIERMDGEDFIFRRVTPAENHASSRGEASKGGEG